MKSILTLLLLSLSLLVSGCAWDKTKTINHLIYQKSEDIGERGIYTIIFTDEKGNEFKFLSNNTKKIGTLKEGQIYNLEYYYDDWSSPDYALSKVEISNKKLEESK